MSEEKKESQEKPEKKELPFINPQQDRSGMETQPMEAIKLPPHLVLPGMKLPSQEESERATQPLAALRGDLVKNTNLPFLDPGQDRSGMATEALDAIKSTPVDQLKRDDQGNSLIPMTIYFRKDQIDGLRNQLKGLGTTKLTIDGLIRVYMDLFQNVDLPQGIQSEKALLDHLRK